MSARYDSLKKAIIEQIALMRTGEATLDDLEKVVVEVTTVSRMVVYHPVHGSKSIETTAAKQYLKDGWYDTPAKFPPERPSILTPEQWEISDARLTHKWGLSLSSFVEDVLGLDGKNNDMKEENRELYNQVIEHYGDKIHQVEYRNCSIWKLKDK